MSLKYRSKIGEKYALSIFSLCESEGNVEEVYDNFVKISNLLEDEKAYDFFDSKLVSEKNKFSLVDELSKEFALQELFAKFFKVLVVDNRVKIFKSIAWEFSNLYNDKKGIEKFEIIVAKSLDEKTKNSIKTGLETIVSKTIVLNESIDESIVGGMILKNRSKVFDDSVSMKLKDFRNHLLRGV